MYYIICEGEENKSEYKFVKAVVTLYANNKPFSIFAAGGYDNLINLISSLDGKLKCGDYVILFFDNVGDDIKVGHIPVVNLLGVLDKLCNDACCVFRYTTYYCFEELLLSYTRLQDMCIKLSKKELEEFKLLQDDMISGKNYYILKQKIEDLDKNSVSVHGEPFSTMFE